MWYKNLPIAFQLERGMEMAGRKLAKTSLRIPSTVTQFDEFFKVCMLYFKYRIIEWTLLVDGKLPTRGTSWQTVKMPDISDMNSFKAGCKQIWDNLPKDLYIRLSIRLDEDDDNRIHACNMLPSVEGAKLQNIASEASHAANEIANAAKRVNEADKFRAQSQEALTAGISNLTEARVKFERTISERDATFGKQIQAAYGALADKDRLIAQLQSELSQARMSMAQMQASASGVALASHAALSLTRGLGFRSRIENMLSQGGFDAKTQAAIQRWIQIQEHLEMMPLDVRQEIEDALSAFELPGGHTDELIMLMKFAKRVLSMQPKHKDFLFEMLHNGQIDQMLSNMVQAMEMQELQEKSTTESK